MKSSPSSSTTDDHLTPAPAISAEGVRFAYREGEPVLAGTDLVAPAARVTAILGRNGVGKTTLLHIFLAWLRPQGGTVRLFDRDIRAIGRREMGRTVSLVPQEEHIPFEYTLLDYVLLGRTPYLSATAAPSPDDIEIAEASLHRVGLFTRAHEPVGEISGGEKQLVLAARSLCQQPRILVLDEPTAHLDLANKRRLVDLIDDLRAAGTTIVFTTHDPDFAAVAADEVALITDGRRVVQGTPAATLTTERLSQTFGLPVTVTLRGAHPCVSW